jgi:hypothetical protein
MALIDLFAFFVEYDRAAYEVHFPWDIAATEAEVSALGRALPEAYRVFLTKPLAGLTVTSRRSGRVLRVYSLTEVLGRLADFPGLVPFLECDDEVFCFDGEGKVVGRPEAGFAELVLGLLRDL